MADQTHQLAVAKLTTETITATAASVGVMTFLGISLSNWVMILTCLWFVILITKWIVTDVWPILVAGENWVVKYFKKDSNE